MVKKAAVLVSLMVLFAVSISISNEPQALVSNNNPENENTKVYNGDSFTGNRGTWSYSGESKNSLNSRGDKDKRDKKIDLKDYTPLINKINRFVKDKTGKYGVYFISLTSRQAFGINENDQFVAASTVKLPINLYLYKKIAEGQVDPEMKLTYTRDDYEEGTGSIQDEEFGKQHTIRELSRLSIEESDNVAINMLIRYLGIDNCHEFMADVQMHPIDTEHNLSNPKEMAFYMKALLDFRKDYKAEGDELIKYMENTEFNDRIPLLLPKDIQIAHKIGTQVGTVNDVGAVFAQKPYIVSIMSKDIDEDEADGVIARISKQIYDFEEKQ